MTLADRMRVLRKMEPMDGTDCIGWAGTDSEDGQPLIKIGGKDYAVRPLVRRWFLPWRGLRTRCYTRGCLNTSHKPGKCVPIALAAAV